MISVSFTDLTRIREFSTTRVGRKILSRALSKTATSGKAEGKRQIVATYTVTPSKVSLYTERATTQVLIATIGATSTDSRGKNAIPLSEFKFKGLRPKKRHKVVEGDPPLTAEIVRGTVSVWKGGFAVKVSSGKTVAIARVGRERYPTRTLVGPSAQAMLLNPRVVGPLLQTIADRMPVVLDQEQKYAMNFETDRGSDG